MNNETEKPFLKIGKLYSFKKGTMNPHGREPRLYPDEQFKNEEKLTHLTIQYEFGSIFFIWVKENIIPKKNLDDMEMKILIKVLTYIWQKMDVWYEQKQTWTEIQKNI